MELYNDQKQLYYYQQTVIKETYEFFRSQPYAAINAIYDTDLIRSRSNICDTYKCVLDVCNRYVRQSTNKYFKEELAIPLQQLLSELENSRLVAEHNGYERAFSQS